MHRPLICSQTPDIVCRTLNYVQIQGVKSSLSTGRHDDYIGFKLYGASLS